MAGQASLAIMASVLPEQGRVQIVEVDLGGLNSDEHEHIAKVLNKAVASEERTAGYSRQLQNEFNLVQRPRSARTQQRCKSSRSAAKPDAPVYCSYCGMVQQDKALRQRSTSASGENEFMCGVCMVQWRYALACGIWRSSEWRIRVPCKGGWGVALVCGLATSGGVLRTYICQVMAGSTAVKAGLMLGDEILSWGHKDLIGRPFRGVANILRYCKTTSAHIKIRRCSRGGEYAESELYLSPQHVFGESCQECHVKTSQMLANPASLTVPNSFSEVELKVGKEHLFPHGRIQITLTKLPRPTGVGLRLEVMSANYLDLAGVTKSAHLSVLVQLKSSRRLIVQKTRSSPQSPHPCWYEHVDFESLNVESDQVKVIVVAGSKMPFFKTSSQLAVVAINVQEARVDNTPQWYTMHSPDVQDPVNLQQPSDFLLDGIYLQHWRQMSRGRSEERTTDSDDENSSVSSQATTPVAHAKGQSRFRVKSRAMATANKFTEVVRGRHRKWKREKGSNSGGGLKSAVSAPDLCAALAASMGAGSDWNKQQYSSRSKSYLSDSDTDTDSRVRRSRPQIQSASAAMTTHGNDGARPLARSARDVREPSANSTDSEQQQQHSDGSGSRPAQQQHQPPPRPPSRLEWELDHERAAGSAGGGPVARSGVSQSLPNSPNSPGTKNPVAKRLHKLGQKLSGSFDKLHVTGDEGRRYSPTADSRSGRPSNLLGVPAGADAASTRSRPKSVSPQPSQQPGSPGGPSWQRHMQKKSM